MTVLVVLVQEIPSFDLDQNEAAFSTDQIRQRDPFFWGICGGSGTVTIRLRIGIVVVYGMVAPFCTGKKSKQPMRVVGKKFRAEKIGV